jgi:hypothetical protein
MGRRDAQLDRFVAPDWIQILGNVRRARPFYFGSIAQLLLYGPFRVLGIAIILDEIDWIADEHDVRIRTAIDIHGWQVGAFHIGKGDAQRFRHRVGARRLFGTTAIGLKRKRSTYGFVVGCNETRTRFIGQGCKIALQVVGAGIQDAIRVALQEKIRKGTTRDDNK